MDTEKFPSISTGEGTYFNVNNQDNMFKNQIIVKKITKDDSIPVDDINGDIFNLPEGMFIEAISIEDEMPKKKLKFQIKSNKSSYSIIPDYYD